VFAAVGYVAVLTSQPDSASAPSMVGARAAGSGGNVGAGARAAATTEVVATRDRLDQALRAHPQETAPLRQLAALAAAESPNDAVAICRDLTRAYPADHLAWVMLAEAQAASGDRASGLSSAYRAAVLAPRSPEAAVVLGKLLASGKSPDLPKAIEAWKRALEFDAESEAGREARKLLAAYEGR